MAAEVHHYKIGDIDVTVLSDGFRMVPVDGNYLSNASTYDLARALAAAGLSADKMKNTYSPIVLTTGGRSERFAAALYADLPEMAFVQMGIFTGDSLKRGVERGVDLVTIGGMIGKIAKLATGQMQTHVAGGGVDVGFLADLARDAGAPDELVGAIAAANTARHVEDLVDASGFVAFYRHVADRTAEACRAHVAGRLSVEVVLFDFEGRVLARSLAPARP